MSFVLCSLPELSAALPLCLDCSLITWMIAVTKRHVHAALILAYTIFAAHNPRRLVVAAVFRSPELLTEPQRHMYSVEIRVGVNWARQIAWLSDCAIVALEFEYATSTRRQKSKIPTLQAP